MEYQPFIAFDPPALKPRIKHEDPLLLLGSCFVENMAERLHRAKFSICTNPHGILFGPASIAMALARYLDPKPYTLNDLFCHEGIWHSWDHHSRFSDLNAETALAQMNQGVNQGADFLRRSRWLIITLGTAFQYRLRASGYPVSNNHRCPGSWFDRRMMTSPEIIELLQPLIQKIQQINPELQWILTISPVRHLREGVQENNRSKARLIEAVHHLVENDSNLHYFPSYEWQMDVLRDYRYYDIDRVHPNYEASQFIWRAFLNWGLHPSSLPAVEAMMEIAQAMRHKPRFPQSVAHREFCQAYLHKIGAHQQKYPYLHLQEEMDYFSNGLVQAKDSSL